MTNSEEATDNYHGLSIKNVKDNQEIEKGEDRSQRNMDEEESEDDD